MRDGPTRKRASVIRRTLEFAPATELRRDYREVYGAEASESVPDERVRESLYEACDELLTIPDGED